MGEGETPKRAVRAQAISDRAWAGLRQYEAHLDRIIAGLPMSTPDEILIAKALYTVSGELKFRQGQVNLEDKS